VGSACICPNELIRNLVEKSRHPARLNDTVVRAGKAQAEALIDEARVACYNLDLCFFMLVV
jgi:hypothetical protein